MNKRLLSRLTLALLAFVVLSISAFYFFQDLLVFQTVSLEANYAYRFDQPFEEYSIPVTESNAGTDVTLYALWF